MNDILKVIPTETIKPATGGSGYGISYYSSAALCSRKFHLERNREVQGKGNSAGKRAEIGILFHELCEYWYQGKDLPTLTSDIADTTQEAQRLFKEYRKFVKSIDSFGAVESVERQLPDGAEEEKRLSGKLCGFSGPITGRVDLVTNVAENDVEKIQALTGLYLEPGIYLWDHKTKARMDSNAEIVFTNSPQFTLYQYLYGICTGTKPKGMVANIVVGTKAVKYHHVLAPYPSDDALSHLFGWLDRAKAATHTNERNLAACFLYGACPFLINGECGR